MEHRFSAKLDNAIGEVKEELCVEKASRQRLEGRVAQLEQQHVREQAASTAQLFEDEDVDKSVVVVGGFGDQALEDAEMLVQQMMVGIAGFKEVDMVNVEQPFFFSRAFLTAERSVARTVLLVSLQACRHERC